MVKRGEYYRSKDKHRVIIEIGEKSNIQLIMKGEELEAVSPNEALAYRL